MPTIPIGGEFYKSSSLPISAQECVNFYSFIPEVITPTKKALLPTPGITLATTAGTDVLNRGAIVFDDFPYFVQGSDLYRVDQSVDSFGVITYSSTKVNGATSITSTAKVMMASSDIQMVIIDPKSAAKFNAWTYDGTTFAAISDTDFDGPVSSVRFVDGYFLFTKKNDQKYFISDLRDGTSYTSTNFANAEASPDPLVSSFVLNNEPILFGSDTMQTIQNIGGGGFPFASVQGSIFRTGLAAPNAVVEINDTLFFLGGQSISTPSMWITAGGKPEKISTTPIDRAIAGYSASTVADCFTWTYSQAGAQFVAFNFPSKACFVFDMTSGEWHTRESITSEGTVIPYRVSSAVYAYGSILVGDSITTNIGVVDIDAYDEYGEGELPRRFVTPHIDNEGMPFFVDSVELVCETGVGLPSGQGSDPLVSMQWSLDGGRTYSDNTERETGIGAVGAFGTRVIWNQLGRVSREICFKFSMSDPIKWAISKVEVNFD